MRARALLPLYASFGDEQISPPRCRVRMRVIRNYSETGGGEYIEISNMRLDCTHMPVGIGHGIATFGVDFTTLDHVWIQSTQAYGVIVGGGPANHNGMQKSPLVQHCHFNNCGRDGGSDSLGGGHNVDAKYLFNVFENCNGTAIDNVNVDRALWLGNQSIANGAGKGSIWSDHGMQRSTIAYNYIDRGTIHVYGNLGGTYQECTHVTIVGNYLKNAGPSAILVSPANSSSSTNRICYGLRIHGNTIDGCSDYGINIGDSPGAIVTDNIINNWSASSASAAAINLDAGLNPSIGATKCIVRNNSGYVGNSTLWYRESASNRQSMQNDVAGNYFDRGTYVLAPTEPRSSYHHNHGSGPVVGHSPPPLPVSGVEVVNRQAYHYSVAVSGGQNVNVTHNGVSTGLSTGSFLVAPGDAVSITYDDRPPALPPTWRWSPVFVR